MKFVPTNWPEENRILQRRIVFTFVIAGLYHFGFFVQTVPHGTLWFCALAGVQLLVNALGVSVRWDALPTFNFFYDQLIVVVLIGISGGAGTAAAFMVALLLISELLWFAQVKLVPWLTALHITNLLAGNLLATTLGFELSWRTTVVLICGLMVVALYLAEPISRLQRDALTDPLTGALNRRAGFSALTLWVEEDRAFQLVFVDLKGFKTINDTHGHGVGDELLRAVAGRLRSSVRQSDLVIRYGGDEFLLGIAGEDGLPERVEELLRSDYHTGIGTFTLFLDVGAARFPDEAHELSKLIELADTRMYSYKQGGAKNTLGEFWKVASAARKA